MKAFLFTSVLMLVSSLSFADGTEKFTVTYQNVPSVTIELDVTNLSPSQTTEKMKECTSQMIAQRNAIVHAKGNIFVEESCQLVDSHYAIDDKYIRARIYFLQSTKGF